MVPDYFDHIDRVVCRSASRCPKRMVDLNAVKRDMGYAGQRSTNPAFIRIYRGAVPSTPALVLSEYFDKTGETMSIPMTFSSTHRPRIRMSQKNRESICGFDYDRCTAIQPECVNLRVMIPAGRTAPSIERGKAHSPFACKSNMFKTRPIKSMLKIHPTISPRMRLGSNMGSIIASQWSTERPKSSFL